MRSGGVQGMERTVEDRGGRGVSIADVAGDDLIARVLAGRDAYVFVLDSAGSFAGFGPGVDEVLGDPDPPELDSPFRPEVFLPAARVTEQVADALSGRESEPSLVLLRRELRTQKIRVLEVFPLRSAKLQGGTGALCLLSQERSEGHKYALDSVLFTATLAERLERERLETTQALIVTIRHEINNALTSLIGNGDLLLRRTEHLDEVSIARLREILGQAYRIRDVLGKLEALSRVRTTTYVDGVRMVDIETTGERGDDGSSGE